MVWRSCITRQPSATECSGTESRSASARASASCSAFSMPTPSMGISLALSGARFRSSPWTATRCRHGDVDVLKLDVAERADVIVEMNNPGVWVFGSTQDDDRKMGMGIVVEYANRGGEPHGQPRKRHGTTPFRPYGAAAEAGRNDPPQIREDSRRPRRLQSLDHQWQVMAGHQPAVHRQRGQTLPLLMNNNSGDEHPVHMHRHTFEVTKVGDKPCPA